MTAFADLLPYVTPYVNGAPAPLVTQALVRTARDFFRRSGVWRVTLTGLNIVSGVVVYPLTAPTGTELVRVYGVTYDGTELYPAGYSIDPMLSALTLTDEPQDGIANGLIVQAVLTPTLAATTVTAGYLDRWGDVIADGAKAMLMLEPKKSWSDAQAGAYYQKMYRDALTGARIENLQGNRGVTTLLNIPRGAM